jgi:hypothetical protein
VTLVGPRDPEKGHARACARPRYGGLRRRWKRAGTLRLTDAGRSLIGPRNLGMRRSPGGVRVRHGAARCGQLRSRDRGPAPCVMTKTGTHSTGAGLSSAVSSWLSPARHRLLALLPRHPPADAPRCDGGVIDDLARWGSCGIPSTVRWDVGGTARLGCDSPSTDAMLLSWPGLVDLGAGGVVCVCGRPASIQQVRSLCERHPSLSCPLRPTATR